MSGIFEKLNNAAGGGSSLGGLLGAGAIGGLAGVLLSGKSLKNVAGNVLAVGGTAAVGVAAWQLYKKWSGSRNGSAAQPGPAAPEQKPEASLPTAARTARPVRPVREDLLFLEAMVFAAKADGHIDEKEQARIFETVEQMYPGQGMASFLDELISRPIDPAALAARVGSPEEAQVLYKLSCLTVDVDHFMERAYLDALARNLGLDPADKNRLEREAASANLS